MFSLGIVEAIDVLKEGITDLLSCCPSLTPDQFSFEGFEEGLDSGIVVAIAFAAHPQPGRRYEVSPRGDIWKPNSRSRF
jgi:hypothetical protein